MKRRSGTGSAVLIGIAVSAAACFGQISSRSVETVLIVRVPAVAKVYLSDTAMRQTGVVRRFTTTAIPLGESWSHYEVRVELERDGQLLKEAKTIDLVGGRRHELTFAFTDSFPRDTSTDRPRSLPAEQPRDGPTESTGQEPKRLITRQLEEYLWQRVYGNKKFDWEIDNFTAAKALNIVAGGGETAAQAMQREGGYFGVLLQVPNGPRLMVYDNKVTYLWTHRGSRVRSKSSIPISLSNREGHRLSPERAFNHIIPQRQGLDQPEMLTFIREGDICVYFHPEKRGDPVQGRPPDKIDQWRCTHAALVIERTLRENAAIGGPVAKKVLSTVDTPSGYAKPFDGSDTTPFHVFRFMPRDEEGHALDDEIANAYRSQAARWGTLMYDKASFNRDYNSMTLRLPEQILEDARSYLGQGEPQDKYCAWLAYTGWCLAYMTPINQRGLPEDLFGPVAFENLQRGGSRFVFKSQDHQYGEGRLADYAAPAELRAHRYEFPFPLVTAPELAMNFLDRTLGPDANYADSEESWVKHATIKAAMLEHLKPKLLETFVYDTRGDTRGYDPVRRTPEQLEEYNERVTRVFDQVLGFYKQTMDLTLASADLPGESLSRVEQLERQSRTLMASLVHEARCASSKGKKWMPPYSFFREAEAYEQFYQDPDQRPYNPRVVYVGTVVPLQFLKRAGSEDREILTPIAETQKLAFDEIYYGDDKIRKALGIAADEPTDAVDALWERLCTEGPQTGFNEYEIVTLQVARNSWITHEELHNHRNQLNSPQWQDRIAAHNRFGIDPILFRRVLVEYWNEPATLRDCLYDDDLVDIAFVANNVRLLFSRSSETGFRPPVSRQRHEQNDADRVARPRVTKFLRCGGGMEKVPTAADTSCCNSP